MRTCALLVCFATFVVLIHSTIGEVRDIVKTAHNECQADAATHIDDESLRKFHSGEDYDKSVVGSHVLCMSRKLGLIDDEGKVDKAKLKRGLARGISDETKLKEVVEKCGEEKDTPQETALAIDKCFWDHVSKSAGGHHHHG